MSFPARVILWKIWCKLFNIKIDSYNDWISLFHGKVGLEIGGPSGQFKKKGYFPLYPHLKHLDGVNYNLNTIWEGQINEGKTFNYENGIGWQYIAEGTDLVKIKDSKYDFLLSCNNLEHIANPIKALQEWKRVLIKGGIVLLVLPNKKSNFDHRRHDTDFQHLIEDYNNDIDESDLTHLEEVLALHDLRRDPQAGNFSSFKIRTLNNVTNRCMHHHVFNADVLKALIQYCGFQTLKQHSTATDHYIAAKKL
jgi:SAM-dependent methyltransferase